MNAIRPSPRAILFDLDDTILSAYGRPEPAWLAIAEEFASQLAPLSPAEAVTEIMAQSRIFWADPGDHRYWRMRLFAARRETVARAFKALADAGRPAPSIGVANALADRFSAWREEQISLFPDAHEVIDALKARDLKLALVTNGEAGLQRATISRFDLARRFDHVQIEGEHALANPRSEPTSTPCRR